MCMNPQTFCHAGYFRVSWMRAAQDQQKRRLENSTGSSSGEYAKRSVGGEGGERGVKRVYIELSSHFVSSMEPFGGGTQKRGVRAMTCE